LCLLRLIRLVVLVVLEIGEVDTLLASSDVFSAKEVSAASHNHGS